MDPWGEEKKSMINKSFPEIVLDDIERLIENVIAESKTIEYKRELPKNSDEGKKEFLADVSSFANSEGGDILFGIEAESGIPTKLSNLDIADNDKARLQYESIIRDGIVPRIKFDIKIIDINNTKVLLIRVYKSWNKPHRVEYKNMHKFYSRHSTGKYLLDIEDLRNAFLSSNQTTEKIRAFINRPLAEPKTC
jgi:predicted HTH transcriptional regulator